MVAIPAPIVEKLLGEVFAYLKKGGENLVQNAATKKAISKAIERAAERFRNEYEDRELAKALASDTKFYDLQSVQKAIHELLEHPFDPAPQIKIENEFALVLPVSQRGSANQAAYSYFEILREELIGVEKLNDKLKLVYLKRTAEATEQTATGVKELVAKQNVLQSEIDETRKKYLQYMIDTNQYVDPRGIMQTRRSVALRLDQVYVSLSVEHEINTLNVDRRAKGEYLFSNDLPMPEYENDGFMDEIGYGLEVIDLAQAVRENSRMIILGDPGSGKTTLLRFLALRYAQAILSDSGKVIDNDGNEYGYSLLPVFLRISNYADAFLRNHSLTMREYLLENCDGGDVSKEVLRKLISGVVSKGNAIILLDGLDEIVDSGNRAEIGRRIEQFVSSCHLQTRIIVTSRIAGYREVPLAREDFTNSTFTIRDMERPQIERFLHKWCPAAEWSQTPNTTKSDIERRAKIEIAGILNAIDKNPGIGRLGANPLMLTILALIHRAGARLPSRRVELYELAAKTLLEDWQLARGIPEKKIVREGEALRLLGPLAYWMHENKPDGLIGEAELKEKVAESLGLARSISPESEEIEDAVGDFLKRVREHTGIFVERAPKKYGFMHLTFEEYFAARELIRRRNEVASRIYEHRHQARWKEPVLLGIAFLSNNFPEDATELISTAILARGEYATNQGFKSSPYEEILNRDLLFAFQVVSDAPYSLDISFANRLASELIDAYCGSSGKIRLFRNRVQNIFYSIRESELAKRVAEVALEKLEEDNVQVRIRIPDILGWLGVVEIPDTVNSLLKLLRDENSHVRWHAASALGWLNLSNNVVIENLLNALDDSHFEVRWHAAFALGWLGVKEDYAINKILLLLQDKHQYVRESAVQVLGQIGVANDLVVSGLLFALKSENSKMKMRAVHALGKLGVQDEQVVEALVDALKDSRWFVRSEASKVLNNLRVLDNNIIHRLTEDANKRDKQERQRAISALGQLRVQSRAVINVLKNALNSRDTGTRSSAAAALGWLQYVDDEIVEGLTLALSDSRVNVRQRASEALGFLGVTTPEVISGLISTITDDHPSVRAGAAASLERLGTARDDVISSLVLALNDGNNDVSFHAAAALGKIGVASDVVINGLCDLLSHNYSDVRGRAAQSLARIYKWNSMNIDDANKQRIQTLLIQGINKEDSRESSTFWQALWDVTSMM